MESAKCVMKLKYGELYNIEIANKTNGYSQIHEYFLRGTEALEFYERKPSQNF